MRSPSEQLLIEERTTGAKLNRREATVEILALIGTLTLGIGCAVQKAALPKNTVSPVVHAPERQMSFKDLLAFLNKVKPDPLGFREYKELGPLTVIIIPDLHDDATAAQNTRFINEIEREWDIQVAGFEACANIDGRISYQFLADRLSVKAATQLPKSGLLAGGDFTPNFAAHFYESVIGRPDFRSIGIEDEKLNEEASLAVWAQRIIEILRENVQASIKEKGAAIDNLFIRLATKDQLHPTLWQYAELGRQLSAKGYTGFPDFDFSKITEVEIDGQQAWGILLGSDEDLEYLKSINRAISNFFNRNFMNSRNEIAARIMVQEMTSKGFKRGAMIFGAGHTWAFSDKDKTIQHFLQQQNVSYVVL